MTEKSKKMLAELDEKAQPVFKFFLELLDTALGEDQYIIFEGRRSTAVQAAYFAQGREPLDVVNRLRQAAGLYLITEAGNKNKITWTMQSNHIDGLAMDVLPVDSRGLPTWDLAHYRKQFEIIRNNGKEAGLVCGADWSPNADWPHYEIRT